MASYTGFLSGSAESSFEKPMDGLNGQCVVHYAGEYRNCQMHVQLVNGKREGEAVVLKDGIPYLKLEYWDGELTGYLVKLNNRGAITLRGHLVNGVESGLFAEYNDNAYVTWRGYYRNGGRYSVLVRSERLGGYYEERSVDTGSLLSIAQYDDSLQNKNGRCMEYMNR